MPEQIMLHTEASLVAMLEALRIDVLDIADEGTEDFRKAWFELWLYKATKYFKISKETAIDIWHEYQGKI